MNKITAYIVIGVIAVVAIILIFVPKNAAQNNGSTILFTRSDCPHCQDVEKYIADNNIKAKVNFQDKEIHDTANAQLFVEKAKSCGIPEEQMGVPMLYDGKNCYQGSDEIIGYFNTVTK